MFFTHDPDAAFYYYGEDEPTSHTYKDLLVDNPPHLISVDVETISLKERIAIGVGISIKPKTSFYFVLFPEPSPAVPWHLLKDKSIIKVFHNSLFDLSALREYDIDTTNIMDTNIMSRLLCYKFNGLQELSFIHKMEVHDVKEYIPKGGTMLDVPQNTVALKCMQDSGATLQLYYNLYEDSNKDYLATEMQLIPICIEMSNRGILIDQETRQQVEDELQEQADFYQSLCEEVGFNPGSPQQVAYILAKRGAYSVFHKLPFTRGYGKKNLSSAVEVLEKMDDPLASIVLKYRGYSKLLSTYIEPWAHDERGYCLAPDTRVLKSNLTWVTIESLNIGDELIGVSKHDNGKWCQVGSIVNGKNTIIDQSYKITTDKGTVIANGEHPWLCVGIKNYNFDKGGKWILTKDLQPTHKIKYFGGIWYIDETYEGGYLSGILDGEGWISRAEVGISQKEGIVSKYVLELLEYNGYYGHNINKANDMVNIRLYGYNALRLLGKVRPKRLLKKSRQIWDGRYLTPQQAAIIISIEPIGKTELIGIQTSTNTFIAEGMVTHNTRFHMDAITGRVSSTDRNMQNIPGKKLAAERGVVNCRNILLPDSGVFTDIDWSQLELRILAYLSQDKEMLHIFETGGDIHQTTAEFLNIPRDFAKNVNFALIYGATDQTLADTAHIRDLGRARQLRENLFKLFTGAGDWIETQHHDCLKTYRARTIFGRNIRLPTEEEESIDGIQRKSIDYPCQGSAAEILKRGLIILKDLPLSLQVHDEILVDSFIPDYVFKPLEEIAPFKTPVEVKYMERWE